jgi:hypothetical protein
MLECRCLDRRVSTVKALAEEAGASKEERNAAKSSMNWRFTTADARIKLKHLYPETVEEA